MTGARKVFCTNTFVGKEKYSKHKILLEGENWQAFMENSSAGHVR
jgi:hypothetical protein